VKHFVTILISCCLLNATALYSKEKTPVTLSKTEQDSALTLTNELPSEQQPKIEEPKMRIWTVSEVTGNIRKAKPDTNFINFNQTATDECFDIATSWLGNMGSPLETKIYFNKGKKSDFLFVRPYINYMQVAEDVKFYNTKTPYSSLSYYRGGPSYGREERLKASFAVNATPNLSFGFNADYIYGRGMYIAQSTNDILSNFWMGYQGKKYIGYAVTGLNHFKNYENGGIKNDSVVRYPELQPTRIKAENMEVNIGADKNAQSQLQNHYILYTQKFRTGKNEINPDDSTEIFVPIINFIHSIKYEHDLKKYSEDDTTAFYINRFDREILLCDTMTRDKAGYHSIKNTVGVELTEDFNKKGRFGLIGYVTHEFSKYQYFAGKTFHKTGGNAVIVGGMITKNNGQHFNYGAAGDMFVYGARQGEFNLSGNISTSINAKNKTIELAARALLKSTTPNRFIQQYESNYFAWNNTHFANEKKVHIDGRFSIPQWNLSLKGGFDNITKYIFFNTLSVPEQYDKNIQVAYVSLRKDFKVWLLHLENEIIYQKSSHEDALPLPELSLYHNLYLTTKIFKVLTFQIGGEVHYHTAYNTPSYNPALGLFYNSGEKAGNYPIMNVYANVHLKRVRFFVMYYHMNYKFSNNNYFSMPNYPINPGMLKMGLQWNFYD